MPFASTAAHTVLDGRYQLDGRIATGGMGEVWRGLDLTLGRPVAVKLLRPEYVSDESFLVRFRGEARHAARLSHPGVASVYDYGEVATGDDHPTAYLVMELVEGEPLSAVLHREKRMSPERTLDVLGQAADALQAAHTLNVVHRDVKPGNLLIRRDGVVKVTDFGIARAVDAAPLTATGIMMGTAYYVSPEQASGRPVTPASDVYSLGVVAYECLAGRRPFDDRNPIVVVMAHQQDNPPPLPPDIPYSVRALVESAMAKDPGRRPASAGAFARTAAGIRRSLWNAESSRIPPGADATAAYAGPTAPPDAYPRNDRPPAWNRQPAWLSSPDGVAPPGVAPSGPGGHGDRGDVTAYAGRPDGRLAPPGPSDTPQTPEWDRGGSHRRSVATQRRLPLPVLVILLLLTVVVTALVTRKLAAGDDGSAASAPLPRGVVDMTGNESGIVSGSVGLSMPLDRSLTAPGPVEDTRAGGGIERSVSTVRVAATGGDSVWARVPWRGDVG